MAEEIEKIFREISDKLTVLIQLKLDDKERSIKDKVELLAMSGLSNKEIAKIVKVSEAHVAKEKCLVKKKGVENAKN